MIGQDLKDTRANIERLPIAKLRQFEQQSSNATNDSLPIG